MGTSVSTNFRDESSSSDRYINPRVSNRHRSNGYSSYSCQRDSDNDDSSEDSQLRLDEFLFHIFQWKPEWLTDRQYNANPPPIVDPKSVISTSLFYENFEDYCKAMLPLLLLEFWHVLKKDGEGKENEADEKDKAKGKNGKLEEDEPRSITISFENDISKSGATGSCPISVLEMGKTITKGEDYPIRGDLVKFQLNKQEFFGYVEDCSRVKVPRTQEMTLKYKIKTRKFSIYEVLGKEFTLTTVLPMGPYLRFVRAMGDLSKSPLFKSVMKPNVEDYEMPPADYGSVFPLTTGHVLDSKQLEVVARVVKTVALGNTKICLIQGPPGTGKSKVILNVICEVLKKKNTKILLCAPSNRAIDEVVGNLIAVQKEQAGVMEDFSIVRIGREEKMGEEVREVSLSFHSKMSKLSLNSNRRELEAKILGDADVIATTLSSCYTFQMENLFGKDGPNIPVCIVDEAAQATELGTLIPLMLGVRTLILVGDPKQLPPTVLSEEAKDRGLDESLFYRAKKNFEIQKGNPILMLNTQYRMVEEIVQWPNNFFYRGALKTGSIVPPLPFHHYQFLHHPSHQDQNDLNHGEARLVVNLIFGMVTELVKNPGNEKVSIGIITPYRKQRKVILDLLKARYQEHAPKMQVIKIAKAGDVDNNANETLTKVPNNLKIDADGFGYDDWEELLKADSKAEANHVQKSKQNGETAPEKNGEKAPEKNGEKKNLEDWDDEKETGEDEDGVESIKVKETPSPLYLKLKEIQVNTVDSFQGQERDIIVMSCVRSRGIGFVNDPNRLCVSLTRAKHTLVLCGNFNTFKRNPMWNALLADAEDRGALARLHADESIDNIMEHVIAGDKGDKDSTDYFLY